MVNRALFLIEKYCDADPKCGPTNAESMIKAAIRSTGLVGETKTFYYDVLARQLGREMMRQLLLKDCNLFRPELIVYTPMGGLLGLEVNPIDGWVPGSAEMLQELRRRGIKLYTHLWDTCGREDEIKQRHIEFSDLCGDVASNADRFNDSRMIQVWSAVDPRDFYNKGLQRDIDVCFIGAVDHTGQRWPQRIRHINLLRANAVNVFVAGGQRQSRLSWEEYSTFLNRAKISLNWSRNPPTNTCQIKGRVFESMACGAMLLEDNGDQTRRFFEPGRDFVMFQTPRTEEGARMRWEVADLVAKVRHYLEHDEERAAIAKSGWEKVTQIYNARNMWGYVFTRMGFEPPEELAEDPSFQLHNQTMEALRHV